MSYHVYSSGLSAGTTRLAGSTVQLQLIEQHIHSVLVHVLPDLPQQIQFFLHFSI